MAANTSFKVPCPSCEASIPIRDPNLIGKKIDCPKCKYRFVVEDPNAPADADDAAATDQAARPKKKGGNNILILGGVLGGVALVLLAVGAYFLFLSGGDNKSASSPSPLASRPAPPPAPPSSTPAPPPAPTPAVAPPGDTANATPPTTNPDNPPANPPPAAAPPVIPTLPPAVPSAPLPPGPSGVYQNVTNLLPGDTQSVLTIDMDRMRNCTLGQQAFESRIGFQPTLFKSKLGIGVEEIARYIRAENLEQKWAFNVIRTKQPVNFAELHSAMNLKKGPKSPIRGREYYEVAPNDLLDHLSTILQSELESKESKEPPKNPKLTTGPLTLVLLDPRTVILANMDVVEEFLTANGQFELRSRLASDAGGGDAPPAGAGDPAGPAGPLTPGTGPGGPGGRPRGDRGEGGPNNPGGGPQFTSRPNYLTIDPSLKSMMERLEEGDQVIAAAAQRLQADPKIAERVRETTGLKGLEVHGMNVLGVALLNLNVEKMKAQIILDWIREGDARMFEEEVKKVLPTVATFLGLYFGTPTQPFRIDVEGGMGGNFGGGGDIGVPGGGAGRPGVPSGPAGVSPPGGGGSPDAPGRPDNPGNPNDPNNPNGPARSTMGITRQGRSVRFNVDLALTERAYDKIYAISEGAVIRMKGMVDMADTTPRWYELASAAKSLPKDGVLQQATYPRGEALNNRLGRSFPPNQRVSWMAGLLPFLGQDELYKRIDTKKSWRDDENLKQGAVLIPQFLNPQFPRASWRAHVPSLGVRDQGATHYVGMAGVGLDAADYKFGDKAVEKKLGMFGYDRRTALKDVTDGLSNTIYVIQVSPNFPRPWLAGGGATTQGAPETKSVQPFVAQHGSKRGTYAIMADGSVRFINANVSDDVFKAMCTIKGGEEIDINKEAPKVDPKGAELKTVQAPNVR
jgi:hypothetical protein